MTNYTEVYRRRIEDRKISIKEKRELLDHDINNYVYQLLKYLYNNQNDTPDSTGSDDLFYVTTTVKAKRKKKAGEDRTETNRYAFPLSAVRSNKDDAIDYLQKEKNIIKLEKQLEKVLKEIAEYNINDQRLVHEGVYGITPFERLEEVKHRESSGEGRYLNRKARFIKSEINSRIITPKITRMRLLLLAYALKMSMEEALELLQSVGENPSFNIWDGYESIVFYAIGRKQQDITLNDLDDLGMIMSGEEKGITVNDKKETDINDTDRILKGFDDLLKISKEASIEKMKELLQNIKASNKASSAKARSELDALFSDVMKGSERIFAGGYGAKCDPGDHTSRKNFQKCRNAITEQFFPYYDNQVQWGGVFTRLQSMRSLPHKRHLKAVDEDTQAVTKADLEFAFFLKFALDNPLDSDSKLGIAGFEKTIEQRRSDYRLQADGLMIRYHFTTIHDMDPFDGLLLLCMQDAYPIQTLHDIAGEYFNIKDDSVEIYDI